MVLINHTFPLSPSIHIQIQFCRLPHPSPAPPSSITVADPRAPTLRSLFSRGLTSYLDPPLDAVWFFSVLPMARVSRAALTTSTPPATATTTTASTSTP